jgi:hypothetical protein
MFTKLVEASKLEIKKGGYRLTFDEKNKSVKVLNSKNGRLSYTVKGESDEMLVATVVYFGLRNI